MVFNLPISQSDRQANKWLPCFLTRICSLTAAGCFCRKTGFGPDQQEQEGNGPIDLIFIK